jgi:hypothetical protein
MMDDQTMLVTAEQELKQQPGVSVISAQDIEKNPPVNDLGSGYFLAPCRECRSGDYYRVPR